MSRRRKPRWSENASKKDKRKQEQVDPTRKSRKERDQCFPDSLVTAFLMCIHSPATAMVLFVLIEPTVTQKYAIVHGGKFPSAFPTAFPDHKGLATCISRCTLSGSRELSFRAATVHNQGKRLPLTVRRKRAQVFQSPLIRWFIRLSLSLFGEEMGRVKSLICEIAVPAVMKVVATTTRVKEHGMVWARGNRQHLGTALWWDHKGGTSAWVIVRPFS